MIYGEAAVEYWDGGFHGVLPLPPNKKKWPPTGYTGDQGICPSFPDVMSWTETHGDHNLAIRLPGNIIGLDVDAYGDKSGAGAWAEAEKRWGPLPKTVRSTSRGADNISGIRLYKIPEGVVLVNEIRFPEEALGNVDVIQRHHRYIVAYPSIHPEGRQYDWYDHDGNRCGIPNINDIPDLPDTWLNGLRVSATEITTTAGKSAVLEWMTTGDPDEEVRYALSDAIEELSGTPDHGRHDACMRSVLRLIRLGERRHPGVESALTTLGQHYIIAVQDRSSAREAIEEYKRLVFGQRGASLIASTPSRENDEGLLNQDAIVRTPQGNWEPVIDDPEAPAMTTEEAEEMVAELLGGTPEMSDEDAYLFGFQRAPEQVEQMTGTDSPNSLRDKLLTIEGLSQIEPTVPLIEGLLYKGTLAQIAGSPGSYKTFLAIGIACAVASSLTEWGHFKIPDGEHGPVLYIAAEGVSGIRARIHAWCEQQNGYDPKTLPLYLYPDDDIQLGDSLIMAELTNIVRDMGIVLVVFDTRARSTVAVDENDAGSQGKLIKAAEKLRLTTGAAVLMIHHSSRSGTAGRGSNVWDGAIWSDMRVINDEDTQDNSIRLHVAKHKDAKSGMDWQFEMKPWGVETKNMPGTDDDARETLVCCPVRDLTPPKIKRVEADIRDVLGVIESEDLGDGLAPTEIAESLGWDKSRVRQTCVALLSSRQIRDVGTAMRHRYSAAPTDELE